MSNNFKRVEWHTEDNIGYLRLNWPDKMNSINKTMADELQEGLKSAIYDDSLRCLVITGTGKAFCVGQNLNEITDRWDQDDYQLSETIRSHYIPIIRMITEIEKPVIGAINGIAAGAGANLAFACDILTASREASFVQSFTKIGLIPDSSGTYLLPRLVGPHRAKQLIMLNESLSAEQAKEWGLVYKVFDDDQFWEATCDLARYLASQPTRAFALTKKALNQSFQNTLEEQLEVEADLQSRAGETDDFKEGVEAFIQKRNPQFKGK